MRLSYYKKMLITKVLLLITIKKVRNQTASDFKMICRILFFKMSHFTVFIHPLRN